MSHASMFVPATRRLLHPLWIPIAESVNLWQNQRKVRVLVGALGGYKPAKVTHIVILTARCRIVQVGAG